MDNKKGQLRLEDVYHHGYVVDFLSSLTVWILQNIKKLICAGVVCVVPIIESVIRQRYIIAYNKPYGCNLNATSEIENFLNCIF